MIGSSLRRGSPHVAAVTALPTGTEAYSRHKNKKNQHDVSNPASERHCPPELARRSAEMLTHKFATASRFVVSSQVLLNTIPTHNCDILLILPTKTDDETLMWLLSRLRSSAPDIHVDVRHHGNSGIHGFYMTASYESLLKGAEMLALPKPLKSEYGGGMKEFCLAEHDRFQGIEMETLFLTSQERQVILLHMIVNLRAFDGDVLGKMRFLEGQAIVPILESKRIVSSVFPLHCQNDLVVLRRTWVQAFFSKQPLDKVHEYFGVKIALYFAYLGYYTAALFLPTLVGMFVWSLQGADQLTDDMCFLSVALFNVIWASLYLEQWKRRSSELSYRWGTLDKKDELIEDPRPLYTGDLVRSTVTGHLEPYYPAWKRNLFHYLITIPVIGLCLVVVFVVMLLIFQFQEYVDSLIHSGDIALFFTHLPKITLAIAIGFMDEIYKRVAKWLNDKENYRMENTYENQLVLKLILFQFVNSFLSLFYIAFYLRDMDRLREQLAALLITRQVIGNIKETLYPYTMWKLKLFRAGFRMTKDMSPDTLRNQAESLCRGGTKQHNRQMTNESTIGDEDDDGICLDEVTENLAPSHAPPSLTQAEVECAMQKYEDTYEDYLEMFIQFGYVTLFSSAFPMAALCALLNNVIEVRSDAFKLCYTMQRPFGKSVPNIGPWQGALEVLAVIAVIVNCALMGVFGHIQRLVPSMSDYDTLVFIIILEHIILAMKFGIAYSIPDIPHWVAMEKARWEFHRREAVKKLQMKSKSEPSRDVMKPDSEAKTKPSVNEKTSTGQIINSHDVSTRKSPTSSPSSSVTSHPLSQACSHNDGAEGVVKFEHPSGLSFTSYPDSCNPSSFSNYQSLFSPHYKTAKDEYDSVFQLRLPSTETNASDKKACQQSATEKPIVSIKNRNPDHHRRGSDPTATLARSRILGSNSGCVVQRRVVSTLYYTPEYNAPSSSHNHPHGSSGTASAIPPSSLPIDQRSIKSTATHVSLRSSTSAPLSSPPSSSSTASSSSFKQ